MKKNHIYLVLLIVLTSLSSLALGYFLFSNSSSSSSSSSSTKVNPASLFESTGNARQDLKNMITFVNTYFGKHESFLFELKDYVSIEKRFAYASCRPEIISYKMWRGSVGIFDSVHINTLGGHIFGIGYTTNGDVSESSITPIVENYFDKSLPVSKRIDYLDRKKNKIYISFFLMNEEGYINDNEFECKGNWKRY